MSQAADRLEQIAAEPLFKFLLCDRDKDIIKAAAALVRECEHGRSKPGWFDRFNAALAKLHEAAKP